MRYIQPRIVTIDKAARAIQSVGSGNVNKPVDQYLDTAVDPARNTTIGAYEADE